MALSGVKASLLYTYLKGLLKRGGVYFEIDLPHIIECTRFAPPNSTRFVVARPVGPEYGSPVRQGGVWDIVITTSPVGATEGCEHLFRPYRGLVYGGFLRTPP